MRRTYAKTSEPGCAPTIFSVSPTSARIVLGTKIPELALGWSTYGVGDQMSYYNVSTPVCPRHDALFLIGGSFRVSSVKVGEAIAVVLDTEIAPAHFRPAREGCREQRGQDRTFHHRTFKLSGTALRISPVGLRFWLAC